MTGLRDRVLRPGSRVRFDGDEHQVVALVGTTVTLLDPHGRTLAVLLSYLLGSDGFEVLDGPARASLAPRGLIDGLSDEEQRQARWWEGHILEVETGRHPDGDRPVRPEYDPSLPLADRERSKVAELRQSGHRVSQRTVRRLRTRYRDAGLWGLIDKRGTKFSLGIPDVAPEIIEIALEILAEHRDGATTTITRSAAIETLADLLDERYGTDAPRLPSRATLYRLLQALDSTGHAWKPAAERRRHANRPPRPFEEQTSTRPGELVEIDTNTFDSLVRFPDGQARRPELVLAIDVATATLLAGVFCPNAKAVDASALLARMVVPEPMRPGWPQAIHARRSQLPYQRLVALDERMTSAAARPVIVPETITADRDQVYLSEAFESACNSLGISLQPARPRTATDKATIERTFGSIRTLFAQYVVGYVGPNTTERGSDLDRQPLFTMHQLQELFDQWAVTCWQNRPHEGLGATWADGKPLTPNDAYAAMVGRTGYVPLALSSESYCELLPVKWLVINEYGINHANRVYDGAALNGLRRKPSGVPGKGKRWEVRYDPYDISHVHVRHRAEGTWITVPWTRAHLLDQPMTQAIYAYATKLAAAHIHGRTPTETDIVNEVRKLRARARTGDTTASEGRVVARDATRPVRPPAPVAAPPPDMPNEEGRDRSRPTDRTHWDRETPLSPFDPRSDEWR